MKYTMTKFYKTAFRIVSVIVYIQYTVIINHLISYMIKLIGYENLIQEEYLNQIRKCVI